MKPLVYLAGPYSKGDPVQNTHHAILLAEELFDRDVVTPLVPHQSLLWQLVAPHSYDWWLDYDLELLARCDALLRFGGKSKGADSEWVWAEQHRLPCFDAREPRGVSDLYRWAKQFGVTAPVSDMKKWLEYR